jgi:hypothetical protein
MEISKKGSPAGLMAKIGAVLFLIWSILHVYVGIAGLIAFLTAPVSSQFQMLFGGANATWSEIVLPTDKVTLNALSHLFGNFVVDVGGYGVLGIIVAWMIWKQGSWLGYLIGAVAIGICDLAFTFFLVTPGIITLDLASVSGPVIWVIAVALTPFGLPRKAV